MGYLPYIKQAARISVENQFLVLIADLKTFYIFNAVQHPIHSDRIRTAIKDMISPDFLNGAFQLGFAPSLVRRPKPSLFNLFFHPPWKITLIIVYNIYVVRNAGAVTFLADRQALCRHLTTAYHTPRYRIIPGGSKP